MRRLFLFATLWCLVLNYGLVQAQVGIGTGSPDSTAILDIRSNKFGVLMPTLNKSQRDNLRTPADGLMIYNSDQDEINVYEKNISQWTRVERVANENVLFTALFSTNTVYIVSNLDPQITLFNISGGPVITQSMTQDYLIFCTSTHGYAIYTDGETMYINSTALSGGGSNYAIHANNNFAIIVRGLTANHYSHQDVSWNTPVTSSQTPLNFVVSDRIITYTAGTQLYIGYRAGINSQSFTGSKIRGFKAKGGANLYDTTTRIYGIIPDLLNSGYLVIETTISADIKHRTEVLQTGAEKTVCFASNSSIHLFNYQIDFGYGSWTSETNTSPIQFIMSNTD